jgi:hypothetical protein
VHVEFSGLDDEPHFPDRSGFVISEMGNQARPRAGVLLAEVAGDGAGFEDGDPVVVVVDFQQRDFAE